MKIAIKEDNRVKEELDIIAFGLSGLGHDVRSFNISFFTVYEDFLPDWLIVTDNLSEDIIQFCNSNQINTICFTNNPNGPSNIPISLGISKEKTENVIHFDAVANIIKYQHEIKDTSFESDIFVVTNGLAPLDYFTSIISKYKVIIGGSDFMSSPCFVGICEPREIVKLAKSSRVTFTTNKVIRDSLLLQNICVIDKINNETDALVKDAKLREDYILNERKHIKTETQFAGIIDEKLRNFDRQTRIQSEVSKDNTRVKSVAK